MENESLEELSRRIGRMPHARTLSAPPPSDVVDSANIFHAMRCTLECRPRDGISLESLVAQLDRQVVPGQALGARAWRRMPCRPSPPRRPLACLADVLDPCTGTACVRRNDGEFPPDRDVAVAVFDSRVREYAVHTVRVPVPIAPPEVASALARTRGVDFGTPWTFGYLKDGQYCDDHYDYLVDAFVIVLARLPEQFSEMFRAYSLERQAYYPEGLFKHWTTEERFQFVHIRHSVDGCENVVPYTIAFPRDVIVRHNMRHERCEAMASVIEDGDMIVDGEFKLGRPMAPRAGAEGLEKTRQYTCSKHIPRWRSSGNAFLDMICNTSGTGLVVRVHAARGGGDHGTCQLVVDLGVDVRQLYSGFSCLKRWWCLPPRFGYGEAATAEACLAAMEDTSRMPRAGGSVAAVPGGGLLLSLMPHQEEALQYMRHLESPGGRAVDRLWDYLPSAGGEDPVPYIMYSSTMDRVYSSTSDDDYGMLGVRGAWGGMLCSEMGQGKTATMLALIAGDPASMEERLSTCVLPDGLGYDASKRLSGATLVVCDTKTVAQWVDEARRYAPELGVAEVSSKIDPSLHEACRVLVTSYGAVAESFQPRTRSVQRGAALHKYQYYRVVFDESHTLSSPITVRFKACRALAASRRWALSGTPAPKGARSLWPQVDALRVGIDSSNAKNDSLMAYLSIAAMRVHAPELLHQGVSEEELAVELDASDRAAYDEALRACARAWEQAGVPVNCNVGIVESQTYLAPLARVCNGGCYLRRELAYSPRSCKRRAPPANAVDGLRAPENTACPVCDADLSDPDNAPMMTPCKHWFCRGCIVLWLSRSSTTCPMCRGAVTVDSLAVPQAVDSLAVPQAVDSLAVPQAGTAGLADTELVECASKADAVARRIEAELRADPACRVVVFGGSNRAIHMLHVKLRSEGTVAVRSIIGSTSRKNTDEALRGFREGGETSVLLLGMRCAAAGLNLTAANLLVFMEPCMEPSRRAQAVGRLARCGQKRPVRVVTAYAAGTLEQVQLAISKARAGDAKWDGNQAFAKGEIDDMLGMGSADEPWLTSAP